MANEEVLDGIADALARIEATLSDIARINGGILEVLERVRSDVDTIDGNVADIEHFTRFPPETS